MDLTGAMTAMADAMTAVNASRRQVRGVAGWLGYVPAADAAAQAAVTAAHRCRYLVSGNDDDLAAYVTQILAAIDPPDRPVSIPVQGTHRGWRDAAAAITAEFTRQARAAGQAAAAASHLTGLAAAVAGERGQAVAAQAGYCADQCGQWQATATDAAGYGTAMARREDQIHIPVGEAVAVGGGTQWLATSKQFHTEGQ